MHRGIVNNLKAFIEPIMISALAIVVGFILVAVIVPMFQLYDKFLYMSRNYINLLLYCFIIY